MFIHSFIDFSCLQRAFRCSNESITFSVSLHLHKKAKGRCLILIILSSLLDLLWPRRGTSGSLCTIASPFHLYQVSMHELVWSFIFKRPHLSKLNWASSGFWTLKESWIPQILFFFLPFVMALHASEKTFEKHLDSLDTEQEEKVKPNEQKKKFFLIFYPWSTGSHQRSFHIQGHLFWCLFLKGVYRKQFDKNHCSIYFLCASPCLV